MNVEGIAIKVNHQNISKFANSKTDGFISKASQLRAAIRDTETDQRITALYSDIRASVHSMRINLSTILELNKC